MRFYGRILSITLFLQADYTKDFSKFLRVGEIGLSSDLINSIGFDLQLPSQFLYLIISLIDDAIQRLYLNFKGNHPLLCQSESLLKIGNLPLLVDQGILLLSDKFHIIQRTLAAGRVGLAQVQHSPHSALQLMFKQEETLTEIFLVFALEDHLRFTTELAKQTQ